jgi:hypothetical protein
MDARPWIKQLEKALSKATHVEFEYARPPVETKASMAVNRKMVVRIPSTVVREPGNVEVYTFRITTR